MAEKNTHSILETIKKKMLKLDKKAENKAEVSSATKSSSEDEFEDISSGDKKEIKIAENKSEVSQAIDPKFEDDLGLDFGKSEEKKSAKAAPEKYVGSESFKDFELDDLDLDNEEKTFPTSSNIAPAKNLEVVHDSALDISEIEKSEDEVEIEDSSSASRSEVVVGDVGSVDWLGNPVNSPALEADDSLDESGDENIEEGEEEHEENEIHDEDDVVLDQEEESENLEDEKEEDSQEHEELEDDLDLDLDHLEDENLDEINHEENKDDLVEKVSEFSKAQELPSFDDHAIDHDEKTSIEQDSDFKEKIGSEKQSDNLEFLTKSESEIESEKEDDFDFADLEKEEQVTFSVAQNVKAEQEIVPQTLDLEAENVDELNSSSNSQKISQNKDFPEPKIERHEIDIEFEKELMGFAPNASESIRKPVIQKSNQLLNVTPMQNESLPKIEEKIDDLKPATGYESTVRQVSDSVKKLIDAKNVVSGISNFSQSPALAELALHLMEPKIEKWFNDNLPELVEKVVREEIKKMIPKE